MEIWTEIADAVAIHTYTPPNTHTFVYKSVWKHRYVYVWINRSIFLPASHFQVTHLQQSLCERRGTPGTGPKSITKVIFPFLEACRAQLARLCWKDTFLIRLQYLLCANTRKFKCPIINKSYIRATTLSYLLITIWGESMSKRCRIQTPFHICLWMLFWKKGGALYSTMQLFANLMKTQPMWLSFAIHCQGLEAKKSHWHYFMSIF